MKSLWKQDVVLKANEGLRHDTSVNTVVIGAGMTGILTAYLLGKKGIDAIVLDAARIGSGQTQNTTAKITSQHGLFYSKMICKVSRTRLKGYAMANEKAIDRFGQIIKDENIDCDFECLPAVLYTTDDCHIRELKKEANTAKKLGITAYYTENMTDASLKTVNAKGAVLKSGGMTSSMIAAEIISDAIRISTDCGVKTKDSGKGIAHVTVHVLQTKGN